MYVEQICEIQSIFVRYERQIEGETLAINEMESLLRLELTCIGSQPTNQALTINQSAQNLPTNLKMPS